MGVIKIFQHSQTIGKLLIFSSELEHQRKKTIECKPTINYKQKIGSDTEMHEI